MADDPVQPTDTSAENEGPDYIQKTEEMKQDVEIPHETLRSKAEAQLSADLAKTSAAMESELPGKKSHFSHIEKNQ